MARKGLDESGRNHVMRLVSDKMSGENVREAIRHRVRSSEYSYDNNIALLDWLRARGYNDSAAYLVKYLEGRI
jgi:hypothetical protein